jgi:hypothetical protein
MEVHVIKEAGYTPAIIGLSFNYNSDIRNMPVRADKLAFKQHGHNKFLESIMLWIEVVAPKYWWTEADTYRLSTKQSESTMHTLEKDPITNAMFKYPIPQDYIKYLDTLRQSGDLETLKNALPEGFLQKRMWVMSYKTLQNIYIQRHNHKLNEWKDFCKEILSKIEHPRLICQGYEGAYATATSYEG